MRPVNKGDAATNGYTNNNATKILFDRKPNKQLAEKLLSTNKPSVECCTSFLVDLIKIRENNKHPSSDQTELEKAIKRRLADLYPAAATPLFIRLGPFCSYCENIITTYLEVEHCLPKANYPTFYVSWDNFLVACGPCNLAKLNKPARQQVRDWLNNNNPTEQQYYDCVRNHHYVWADLDEHSYQDMQSELYYKDSGGVWQEVPPPGDTNLNNAFVSADVTQRVVMANIDLAGTMSVVSVQVRITADTTDRALELTELCKLNYIGNTDSTNDRRLFTRTQAYFTALHTLSTLLNPIVNQQLFDMFWSNYLFMAKVNGFYSIFLVLLTNRTDPSGNQLFKKFVTETNNSSYFPNTNTTQLIS